MTPEMACIRDCALLHNEEIQHRINYVINDRRREIYCDIYPEKSRETAK